MENIIELFLPYEESLALRGLGFNEHVLAFYWADTKQLVFDLPDNFGKHNGVHVQCPLYEQAFQFFREKYNLFASYQGWKKMNYFDIVRDGKVLCCIEREKYNDAKLDLIKNLIKIVNDDSY